MATDAPIRRASPEEPAAVVETVAAAFADDPAWAFMLGEGYARLAVHFAAALFDVRIGPGGVWHRVLPPDVNRGEPPVL